MRTDEAVRVATLAAAQVGMPAHDAQVLRVGENGVVLLPGVGVLARVVQGAEAVQRVRLEIAVADWLASQDVPVARPVRSEPIVVDRHVVSLWEYLPGGHSADLVTLARCLRLLHGVARPVGLLTRVSPFSRLCEQLALAVGLDERDRTFLHERRDQLAVQWEYATFALGEVVLHGDAHMENLLVTAAGRCAFIDLESVCVGPPEWDLTLSALYYECGWFSGHDYATFTHTYGYDVRRSPAWPLLRQIRMLRMTLWLAQSADNDAQRRQQLRHRLDSLRDGSAPAGWTGF
ncbi:aminoglycoside phosphotransferase family protein [Verrucosispora sp. ts21]|uniref:phosphotransferase enzyme family protein n=1 Tax=Verrucosispora sp. ts21 TaxID=2069341 RepID=UPI000C888AE8|nr:aminoglycoside phosphotransferase family protein [Verrucosispora sp. ts21]PMR58543.1 aminoglycoside phosphotransferase family protein [Verrucosispora sp. ts21]